MDSFQMMIKERKLKDSKGDILLSINSVLRNHDLEEIELNDFDIIGGCVTNIMNCPSTLTDRIIQKYIPNLSEGNYSHYTSLESLDKILNKGTLRFYSLNKHFSQEYKKFYGDHDLRQFISTMIDDSYLSLEEENMQELFYMSFTNTTPEVPDGTRWNNFSKPSQAIRIEFSVKNFKGHFRSAFYENSRCIPLLQDLMNAINKFDAILTLSQISSIGAFYFPNNLNPEFESRFLINGFVHDLSSKKIRDEEESNKQNMEIYYIEEPFHNEYGRFEIIGVEAGENCDLKKLNSIILKHNIKLL